MHDKHVQVPLYGPMHEVRVIALHKGKEAGPFEYLQAKRSDISAKVGIDLQTTEVAKSHHRNVGTYSENLANWVPGPLDGILSPPSTFDWQAEPYRKAIASKHHGVVDLTAAISRHSTARASSDAMLDDVLAGLSFNPNDRLGDLKRLVIVDDTFRTGTTAAAIIELLTRRGLPNLHEVIVACPLWLDTTSANENG